ncbi:class I SAM-dependent methyltransferase [Chitinilyticum piscinae]|uniref:Class I SAM-dependent methyltransferase n=1 Tax=Chitinilyticum piscinae TaxID=2866724 RepID=A0A8J7KBL4_9NEIS|nr:class I SAM-dependent methyltransferase [Chitinilyticum piscinae]MBE9610354.1 class I SAM-dependent methyltransferase [Chitinilyticum piscinae]
MADLASYRNRLLKNHRHWGKWARRQGLEAYRIYDRDVPEFPVIVDVYGERVHLQEFDTGWQQSEEEHSAWLEAIRLATADVLGIPAPAVVLKRRERQKGTEQYEKTGEQGEDFVVVENGLKFWVNLGAYLDTGLFLDHRNTRKRVLQEAAGKRFLNLFSYTGAFSVYAAAGGARESLTVDLSNTYLDWAGRNFELNGIDSARHQRVRADVFQFLQNAMADRERFDLIVMDPPSFSNSKKMAGVLDVQRDHPWLIESCLELLNPAGVLYFSNNLRSFKLDDSFKPLCEDLSAQSVPEDFRNKRIHQCWRFVKKA